MEEPDPQLGPQTGPEPGPGPCPGPEDYVQATKNAFAKCPRMSGLRLESVQAGYGYLTIRFEGPEDDFRGPYGAIIRLPRDRHDALWARYAADSQATIEDWAYRGVAMRADHARTASRTQHRGYTLDGIWWLINDTT